ncbi:ras guanine nucleotide exchange factor domain-containing protein, partial [Blyttiomyces helicus]
GWGSSSVGSGSGIGGGSGFSSFTSQQQPPFIEIDNEAVARQLDLLESEIFHAIKPRDLLQHIWSRRHKGRHAPSVAASIGHFNFISSWVTTQILLQKKLKTRAKVLGKFMKIAQILRNSNNYNTLMAVLAGINSAPILRLRQTRKLLQSRQSYRNYLALEKLMSSERSFGAYRQAWKRSEFRSVNFWNSAFSFMTSHDSSCAAFTSNLKNVSENLSVNAQSPKIWGNKPEYLDVSSAPTGIPSSAR